MKCIPGRVRCKHLGESFDYKTSSRILHALFVHKTFARVLGRLNPRSFHMALRNFPRSKRTLVGGLKKMADRKSLQWFLRDNADLLLAGSPWLRSFGIPVLVSRNLENVTKTVRFSARARWILVAWFVVSCSGWTNIRYSTKSIRYRIDCIDQVQIKLKFRFIW